MLIVGINAYHGDASAAAIVDGRLVAAAEEERFTRVKHAAGFPAHALRYVVAAAGASPADVRVLAVARDPWARWWQKGWHAVTRPRAVFERGPVHARFAGIAGAAAAALGIPAAQLAVHRVEHHAAHVASSFYVSPFEDALLLSIDGFGDFASALWGVGRGTRIHVGGVVPFPHSLGICYTALTQYLGFPQYGDEYKVMGLAAYGEPEYLDELRRIVRAPNHGSIGFELGLDYFTHHRGGGAMTWAAGAPQVGRLYSDHLVERLGPARQAAEPVDRRHQNVAASLQRRLEEILLDRLRTLQQRTGVRRVCLAGGVAFNCVANGKIVAQTGCDEIYVQPAAGDAGLAIGAAFSVWHQRCGRPRGFVMEHPYWGPAFSRAEIAAGLHERRATLERSGCQVRELGSTDTLCRWTAAELAAGKVVGWFQDRMEWGPRALGNRSILADPRRAEMREVLNVKIKRRELFRPFAPSILAEAVSDYFEPAAPSPFMLMAYTVRPDKRAVIPAATHVDGTGRVHTVTARQNARYYQLIREFGRRTGVPVLLNTSFNESEPVVLTPGQALDCFLRTEMDVLVLGDTVVTRGAASGATRETTDATAAPVT